MQSKGLGKWSQGSFYRLFVMSIEQKSEKVTGMFLISHSTNLTGSPAANVALSGSHTTGPTPTTLHAGEGVLIANAVPTSNPAPPVGVGTTTLHTK